MMVDGVHLTNKRDEERNYVQTKMPISNRAVQVVHGKAAAGAPTILIQIVLPVHGLQAEKNRDQAFCMHS